MHDVKLTKNGFRITFTKPADQTLASDPANYPIERWGYHYHPRYGSPKTELKRSNASKATLSKDGTEVLIETELEESRVYKLNLAAITAKDGSKLANTIACQPNWLISPVSP